MGHRPLGGSFRVTDCCSANYLLPVFAKDASRRSVMVYNRCTPVRISVRTAGGNKLSGAARQMSDRRIATKEFFCGRLTHSALKSVLVFTCVCVCVLVFGCTTE